jgi:hypothetical protein
MNRCSLWVPQKIPRSYKSTEIFMEICDRLLRISRDTIWPDKQLREKQCPIGTGVFPDKIPVNLYISRFDMTRMVSDLESYYWGLHVKMNAPSDHRLNVDVSTGILRNTNILVSRQFLPVLLWRSVGQLLLDVVVKSPSIIDNDDAVRSGNRGRSQRRNYLVIDNWNWWSF